MVVVIAIFRCRAVLHTVEIRSKSIENKSRCWCCVLLRDSYAAKGNAPTESATRPPIYIVFV